MPIYIVTAPNGKEYEVDAPEGATQEQALDYFKSNWKPEKLGADRTALSEEQIEARRQAAMKSMARAESPLLAEGADILAGMTGIVRGILPESIEQSLFPTRAVRKDTKEYIAGQMFDPAAWAIGGGAMKGAQMLPKVGQITKGLIGGAAGGSAIGGLSDGSATEGAMIGGAIGGGIPAVAVAASILSPVAKNVLNSISAVASKGGRASVGQKIVLQQLPPAERDEVLKILQAQGVDISPFSQLTSAEAIAQQNLGRAVKTDAGAGIAALEQSLSKEPAARAIRAAREERAGDIERHFGMLTRGRGVERQSGMSPEDVARQALEGQRSATATQLYPKGSVSGDKRLDEIMSRPAVETAERVVGTSEANIPTQMITQAARPANSLMNTPKQYAMYSLESLANRYRSMETAANRLSKVGRDEEANAIRAAKNDLGKWLENASPEWAQAQRMFAYQSRPINQSEVATDLLQKYRTSRGQFLGATEDVRAQEALTKSVLGRADTPLSKVFDPKQMSKIEGLRTEAQIYDEVERLRGMVKPKTEGEKPFQLPNLLNAWVAVANRLLREGGKATVDDITEEAARILADPNKFRNLLMKDAAERAKIGKVPMWAARGGMLSAPVASGMLTGEPQ